MHWSCNLAYGVGFITTDGSLSNDGRHISFTSKDFEQITNLAKALQINNKIGTKVGGYSKSKKYDVLQYLLYLSRKKDKIDRSLDIIQKQAGMLKLVDRHA